MILNKNHNKNIVVNPNDLAPSVLKFLKSLLKRNNKPAPFCDGHAFCSDCIVNFRVINQLLNGVPALIKDDKQNVIDETVAKLIYIKDDGILLTSIGFKLAKKIQYFHI